MNNDKFSDRAGRYVKDFYRFLMSGASGMMGLEKNPHIDITMNLASKWGDIKRREQDYNRCMKDSQLRSLSSQYQEINPKPSYICETTMFNYWNNIFSTIENYGYEKRSDYFIYSKKHRKFIKYNDQVPENLQKYPERRFSDYL